MEAKILQAIESLKDDVNHKFDFLTNKVDGLAGEVKGLTNKVDGLSGEVKGLTNKVDGLSSKVDNQGNQIEENTQILKALEHLAQVNKAEHDKMSYNIAEISGEVKALRNDLSNIEQITASNWGYIAKLKSLK